MAPSCSRPGPSYTVLVSQDFQEEARWLQVLRAQPGSDPSSSIKPTGHSGHNSAPSAIITRKARLPIPRPTKHSPQKVHDFRGLYPLQGTPVRF